MMTKHEMPPFNMIIEGGRLVPATAYDAERIDSFRRGTKVKVRFTEEKDRILVRKWFAIIGLVLKQCNTPWKNKDQAHEAIKLALGIVNLSKTIDNEYMQYPKSLTELEDPELQDALNQMTDLLSQLVGVDVETLKKEAARIVPDQPEEEIDPETGEITNTNPGDQSPPDQPEDDATAQTAALSQEPSKDSSPDDGEQEPAGNQPPSAGSPSDYQKWLLNVARMLWVIPNTGGDLDLLDTQREAALISFPKPEGLPKAIDEKAKAVFRRCQEVIGRSMEKEAALEIISGNVGVEPAEILRKAGS